MTNTVNLRALLDSITPFGKQLRYGALEQHESVQDGVDVFSFVVSDYAEIVRGELLRKPSVVNVKYQRHRSGKKCLLIGLALAEPVETNCQPVNGSRNRSISRIFSCTKIHGSG